MIPGVTSKISEATVASAATINIKADTVYVTGSTAVTNMIPNFGGGFSGQVLIVTTDGAVAFNTGGNIQKAATTVQNQGLLFVYSKSRGKWFPGPVS